MNFAGSLQALNGGYAQTYTGTGTFGTGGLRLGTLSVQNSPGVTIDPGVSALNVNRVNAFYGAINNSDKISIGAGDATVARHSARRDRHRVRRRQLRRRPDLQHRHGAADLVYAQSQAPVTTGPEIPGSRTVLGHSDHQPDRRHDRGRRPHCDRSAARLLLLSVGHAEHELVEPADRRPARRRAVSGGSAATWVNGPLVAHAAGQPDRREHVHVPGRQGLVQEASSSSTRPRARAARSTIEAEAFDADSGGTAGAGFDALNHNRYWSAQITGGAAQLHEHDRPPDRAGDDVANAIGQSATVAGAYDSIGGVVLPPTIGQSNTITTLGYFAVGRLTGASTISGSFNVGTGGDFTTLTAAVAALNTPRHDRPGHLPADRQHVPGRDASRSRSTRTAARARRTR